MKKKLLLAAGVVLLVLALVVLWPLVRGLDAETILHYTPRQPVLAALVLVLLYCAKNVLMFLPIVAFYVAAGMLFPFPWALLVTYIGIAAEFSLGFWVGRRIGPQRVGRLVQKRPRAEQFLRLVRQNQSTACFISRLVPLPVPLDVVSMFFGATGMAYGKFISLSLLAISAPMIPFVLAGEAISNPFSARFLVPFGISLGVSAVGFVLFRLSERRTARRAAATKQPLTNDENRVQ